MLGVHVLGVCVCVCVFKRKERGPQGTKSELREGATCELRSASLGIPQSPDSPTFLFFSSLLFYIYEYSPPLFSPLCYFCILPRSMGNNILRVLSRTLCDQHAICGTISALSIVRWRRIPWWSPEPARSNRHEHTILQNEIMRSRVDRVE